MEITRIGPVSILWITSRYAENDLYRTGIKCMKFEDITFYNPFIYHYNLYDKRNFITTG